MTLQELSKNKQVYVKARVAGKNKYQAAREAGYSHGTSRLAGEVIETADVRAVFRQLVSRAAPMTHLAKRLAEGLDATETRLATCEGKFTDERKVADYAQRRAYAQLVAEYAGYVEKDAQTLAISSLSLSVALPAGSEVINSPGPEVINLPATSSGS
jgi:hypothetical protein